MSKFYDYYGNPIELDTATGMPKLPDNMFWRITHEYFLEGRPLSVQLRKHGRFWSRKVYACSAEGRRESVLFWAAFMVHHKMEPEAKRADLSTLLGDYPPNKLED